MEKYLKTKTQPIVPGAKPNKKTTFVLYSLSSNWPLLALDAMFGAWLCHSLGTPSLAVRTFLAVYRKCVNILKQLSAHVKAPIYI